MKIKWKEKNKKLNPDIILEKIKNIRKISDDGTVSFSGTNIEFYFSCSALETMIDFPKDIDGRERKKYVWNAICDSKELNKESVIKKINEIIKKETVQSDCIFHILSSISLSREQIINIQIEDCNIELLGDYFPEKYRQARISALKLSGRHSKGDDYEIMGGYNKILITVKAKSANRAFTKALDYLDLQRAIWCLLTNQERYDDDEWNPINKIRLGEIHTVHNDDGGLAAGDTTYWYEPNFVKTRAINPWNEVEYFEKESKYYLSQLEKSKDSDKLKDALLRYVRALDERDQNNALIKLWSVIESLTSPSVANCDLVIKRCAFLFEEHVYYKQVLEHLREYRNRSVHAGDQSNEAKKHCFQLQFYFRHLIIFYIKNAETFPTLDKANEFLDLPPNRDELLRKKELIELALSFVSS